MRRNHSTHRGPLYLYDRNHHPYAAQSSCIAIVALRFPGYVWKLGSRGRKCVKRAGVHCVTYYHFVAHRFPGYAWTICNCGRCRTHLVRTPTPCCMLESQSGTKAGVQEVAVACVQFRMCVLLNTTCYKLCMIGGHSSAEYHDPAAAGYCFLHTTDWAMHQHDWSDMKTTRRFIWLVLCIHLGAGLAF